MMLRRHRSCGKGAVSNVGVGPISFVSGWTLPVGVVSYRNIASRVCLPAARGVLAVLTTR